METTSIVGTFIGMEPSIIWLTGLSGAGKSTTAQELRRLLRLRGHAIAVLDGDELRRGLNSDLGFGDADRIENIRRTGEVARFLVGAGVITIVSLISPFRKERDKARQMARPFPFFEVYIDAPLHVCEARDPKGLYRKAREGLISHFTGINSAYEAPVEPDLHLRTDIDTPASSAETIIRLLDQRSSKRI